MTKEWINDRIQYHNDILNFFKDKPNNLFIVNIGKYNWQNELLKFIGKPTTDKIPELESLNEFLPRLLSRPDEEYVNNAIHRLYLIGVLDIRDKVGKITLLGHECLRYMRELKRIENAVSVINSYNFNASYEVIDAVALLEITEGSLDKLFSKPRIKDKNSPEAKEKMDDFNKKRKFLASASGDHITAYKILNKYREKKFGTPYPRRDDELKPQNSDDASKWIKENYLNNKKIKKALDMSKKLNNLIGRSISFYRREHPNANKVIFRETKPRVSDKIEENIIASFLSGYVFNTAKKSNKDYKTCFPQIQTYAQLDRFSLFNEFYGKKLPSYGIYYSYDSRDGRQRINGFSKLFPSVIPTIGEVKDDKLIKCMSDREQNKPVKKNKSINKKKSLKKKGKKKRKR